MNENDLRVQRTRRLLQEALIELANQHDFGQITIRDITQTAQVGYKTFFRHYENKDALMLAIVESFIEQFQQAIVAPDEPDAVRRNTLIALQIARENREMYRAILNSPSAAQLLHPVLMMGYEDGKRFFGRTSLPNTLVAHHFTTSTIALLAWWLDSDETYSAEEMVAFIDQLLIRPIERLHKT